MSLFERGYNHICIKDAMLKFQNKMKPILLPVKSIEIGGKQVKKSIRDGNC